MTIEAIQEWLVGTHRKNHTGYRVQLLALEDMSSRKTVKYTYLYSTSIISYSRVPFGAFTAAISPSS